MDRILQKIPSKQRSLPTQRYFLRRVLLAGPLVPIDHNGNVHGMQVYINIETDAGTGKGLVRLLHKAESQKWKAFTVYTALFELSGHVETVRHRRQPGFIYKLPGTTTEFDSWQKMRIAQKDFETSLQPTVLIIGKAI